MNRTEEPMELYKREWIGDDFMAIWSEEYGNSVYLGRFGPNYSMRLCAPDLYAAYDMWGIHLEEMRKNPR